jgi:aspartate/methionine/tyrosine aminotransferase
LHLDHATLEQLREWEQSLSEQYTAFQQAGLNLDLTRGKPGPDQLDLSNALDGILQNNYKSSAGVDVRNYGGIDGLAEAKALFASMINTKAEDVMVGGNSSLALMFFAVQSALYQGVNGSDTAWSKESNNIKFLAPVPGYDRHFSVCEQLGIQLIPVSMTDSGPDMDQVEERVKADPLIKGIWCVPRFSNPTGIVYSDDVVARMAKLPTLAGENFRIFWDNAYSVHVLEDNAPELASIMDDCRNEGTEDGVYIFGSTSKVTFAGAGVAFMASSPANIASLTKQMSFSTIGPDKINQLRHAIFLKDRESLKNHMAQHAAIIKPRFDTVLDLLNKELLDCGMATWVKPKGGYFISVDTLPGLAREVVKLCAAAGVKLTPAGATFPYGNDPDDSNIRLAPTFPNIEEIREAMAVFVNCVKLASVRQKQSTQ